MTIYLKSNLRYIRKSMGMTQDEFAAKTGMSRSVIGAYEEGRATPSLKRLVELSEMFGVSLDDLVLKDLGKRSPKVGDYIKGSWRDDVTGNTFYTEGTVKEYPAGLFVQFEDEGITPLKSFFHFSEIKPSEDMTG